MPRNFNTLTIAHAQDTQPWRLPYSDNFNAALTYTGPNGYYLMPHLMGTHAVLHAQKTVGQLAAVFEQLDHSGAKINADQRQTLADKSADLMTAALRLANLYGFNLAQALVERSEEKNNVVLPDWNQA